MIYLVFFYTLNVTLKNKWLNLNKEKRFFSLL
jgi:hypothetical protein